MSRDINLVRGGNNDPERKLAAAARFGRSKALKVIAHYCVVTTDDGFQTREVNFDHPPTVGQLFERVGPDAWVVSVTMRQGGREARPARITSIGLKF